MLRVFQYCVLKHSDMCLTFFILLFVFNTFLVNALQLNVAVYYETLCPDSIQFITNQFYPTWKETENYLKIDLVPFGFATASNSTGQWKFECQHGPLECYGNKVHSCVLADYPVHQSIEFINCAMSRPNPNSKKVFQTCSDQADISWDNIEDCLNSGTADVLLVKNGEKTENVSPKITFIPAIAINNVYNRDMQNAILHHFLKTVCELLKDLPDICKYLNISVMLMDNN